MRKLKLNLQMFGANATKSVDLYSSGQPNKYPYTLMASFVENNVNTSNNTSSVTVTATLKANGQYWSTSYNSTLAIYWYDNKTGTETLKNSITFAGLSGLHDSKTVTSTFNATHKNDGTLSGYAKAVFTKGSTTSVNAPPNGNVQTNTTALTSIARVSTITCTSPYIGDVAVINLIRSDNSYTDTITYTIGSITGTIATKTSGTSFPLDTSSLASSIYAQMSSTDVSKQGTITVETFNANNDSLGTNSSTFYLYAKESDCKPTITATIIDTNSTTTTLTGDNNKIVIGYSNAQVTYTITPNNGATITSQTINGVALGTSPYTITNTTLGTFNIVVTDSRNFTSTLSIAKPTINYIPLALNINDLYRTAPASDEVKINFQGTYFNNTFGNTTNSLTLVCKYRVKGASAWTTLRTLAQNTDYTIDGNTFYSGTSSLATDIILNSNAFSYNNVYEIAIFYQDALIDSFTYKTVPKGVPVVNWEDGLFNVNGDLTISDTDGQNPIDVGAGIIQEMNTNTLGTYIKFTNGVMITYQDWVITSKACTTAWGSLYATNSLTPPNFPQTFYSAPSITIEKKLTTGQNFWIMKNFDSTITNAGDVQLLRATSIASISTTLCIMAIGRWKA